MMVERTNGCNELNNENKELVDDEFKAEETLNQLKEIFGDLVISNVSDKADDIVF